MKISITSPGNYRGFARLAVYGAKVVSEWPMILVALWGREFSPAGLRLRVRQEVALARGRMMAEVLEMI